MDNFTAGPVSSREGRSQRVSQPPAYLLNSYLLPGTDRRQVTAKPRRSLPKNAVISDSARGTQSPACRQGMEGTLHVMFANAGVFCASAFRRPSGPDDDEQRLSPLQQICKEARDHLFIRQPNKHLTFYPSSAAKTWGICAVVDNLPVNYASLALAADKARRVDFNRSLSDWKTGAAGRVYNISLPKLGLFRDERDAKSPWAPPSMRTPARVRDRVGLGDVDAGTIRRLALSRWSYDRNGIPFASGAFTACARAAFRPRMVNGTMTLKLYHVAWLEHVVTDAIRNWEARKGRLSNSAGCNAHIMDGLHVLVKSAVTRAIAEFKPEYDAASQTWAWGRHGLRISADGIAGRRTASAQASVSLGTPQA
ncbi:unnamed protein product [Closterium sp. NIES-54]